MNTSSSDPDRTTTPVFNTEQLLTMLHPIGLQPADLAALAAITPTAITSGAGTADATPPQLMRVTELQREGLTLHDGLQQHPARQLPALRHRLAACDDALAVGDWVLASCNVHGQWWAAERLPPRTQLARRVNDEGGRLVRAVIVSNVDTALLVMGLDADYNPRRLARYLALARLAGVLPVVVLTKADLCADEVTLTASLAEVRRLLPPGGDVVAVNALGSEPRRALAPWLQSGQTLALLGSSGAGKSTLTNALTSPLTNEMTGALTGALTSPLTGTPANELTPMQGLQLTGATRRGDGRGRHTTTARSLHRTPEGACIIDTPGLRTLRLEADEAALTQAFDDVATLAPQCRFRNCRHEAEPGCAVAAALAPERLLGFHKLVREARRDTLTALQRREQVAQWKARSRASRVRVAGKRGDDGA